MSVIMASIAWKWVCDERWLNISLYRMLTTHIDGNCKMSVVKPKREATFPFEIVYVYIHTNGNGQMAMAKPQREAQ